MEERNAGLIADPLFVGATRAPMRWGVTYVALLGNMVITMEIFLATKNLLTLLLALPIHGLCALLCARDPRFFDLALLVPGTGPAATGPRRRASTCAGSSPAIGPTRRSATFGTTSARRPGWRRLGGSRRRVRHLGGPRPS